MHRIIATSALLLTIGLAAAAWAAPDYNAMTTDELAAKRGAMQGASAEERKAFQNAWQNRLQKMTPEEHQKYMRTEGPANSQGTGPSKAQGMGPGSGPMSEEKREEMQKRMEERRENRGDRQDTRQERKEERREERQDQGGMMGGRGGSGAGGGMGRGGMGGGRR